MKKYMIQTARLGLRPIEKSDLPEMAKLNADPEVRQFFPDGVQTLEQSAARMQDFLDFYRDKGIPCFAVFELESQKFVGRAGFGLIDTGEIEVGYVLHKAFWNKGYASELLTASLSWANDHIKASFIIGYAPVAHTASQRVMEKCGMKHYKDEIVKDTPCRFYRITNKNPLV